MDVLRCLEIFESRQVESRGDVLDVDVSLYGGDAWPEAATAAVMLSGYLDDALTDEDLNEALEHFQTCHSAGIISTEQWQETIHEVIATRMADLEERGAFANKRMKVAIVSAPPEQTLCDKLAWVSAGFRAAGHAVRRCYTLQDIKAADHQCDLMVLDHKNSGLCPNSLADLAPSRWARWVQWYRDLVAFYPEQPLSRQPYIDSFKRLMRQCDAVLVKERSLLQEYRDLGIKAHWFDQACPFDMPQCEHRASPEWDVLVVGSASYEQRRNDARALADAGFRVLWVGLPCGTIPPGCESMPWQHPTLELPKLASRCAVVLGVDWRSDLDGFTSDRTYLVTGMGACLVRRTSPGMPDIPSFAYASHDRLISLVRQLVGDVARRRRTGEAARKCVIEHHTYEHRARELVALLEKLT